MIRKIEDFEHIWRQEKVATLKLFGAIKDDVLNNKLNDNVRTLRRLAWHITESLTEMAHKAGLIEDDYLHGKELPDSIKDFKELYAKYADLILLKVKENWTDDSLFDKLQMYGQEWEKTKLLTVLINHQIHHRGQMTVIMRLLDIVVPGIYGPAKEEWAKFGMPTQE